MKVLITGFPGTGKSTIAKELKKRGRHAYDPENMYSYMHLVDRETGLNIKRPEDANRGWYDTVGAFNWDTPRVSALLEKYEDVFICSLAHNMNLLADSFDYIFVLTLDDFELQRRLEKRGSGLSTTPSQLADILTLHEHFEQSMASLKNATLLSVKPSVDQLVDTILETTSHEPNDR